MAISCSGELTEALNKPRNFQCKHIGEILLQTGIINPKQLQQAITKKASKYKNERLGKVISKLGFATEHQIINAFTR
jgi:type IV pilus assembly protein PilB